MRAFARFVSNGVSKVNTPNAQIATTGRLMKKIQGQVQLSLIVPPRMGPRIGAVVVVAGLLFAYPFEMLALVVAAYLALIPVSVARYRKLEREHAAAPAVPTDRKSTRLNSSHR